MSDKIHRQRWPEIEAQLDELLVLAPGDRQQRLDALRSEDAELHEVVERLLLVADDGASFLDEGVTPLSGEALVDTLKQVEKRRKLTSPGGQESDRVIGRYRLDTFLGSGGMSEVWLAHRADDALDQTVAVKLLRPFLGHDAEQRFERERGVLASLQHDGITRILDAGVATGDPAYLVLEYVDGVPVTEYCRKLELRLSDVLALFLQICDAVEYAHRHLVIHRDIKPSNVLVTPDGKVKLLDFGIAKLIDDTADRALTRSGLFPMTPGYAAPEQIRGEMISTATDVYGLGGLLYEMLTTRRPFDTEGLSPVEIEKLVFNTDPARPSTRGGSQPWRGALKGDLDTIILKALQSSPQERYGSAADLAEDVRRFLAGRPITAARAGALYRMGKFVRRNRTSLGIAALLLVAVTAGTVNAIIQAERERTQIARFESTLSLLFGLYEKVDPDLYPGQQISPVGLLDIGAEQLSQLDAGPEHRVDMQRVLGVLYSKLGERERGEEFLRDAVETARTTLDPSNSTIGQALNSLGRYLAERGKLKESETVLRESLAALTIAKDEGAWLRAAERDLAHTLALQGRGDDAVELYRRNIAAHGPLLIDDPRNLNHRNFISASFELAAIYAGLDRLDDAESELQETVPLAYEKFKDHPVLARCLEVKGMVDHARMRVTDARAAWQESLAIFRSTYPNGHQSIGRLLAALAALENESGNKAVALRLYDEALSVWNTLPDGTHAEMADRLHTEAEFERAKGNLSRSLAPQRKALAARLRAHENIDHWRVVDEQTSLSEIEAQIPAAE
jgi:serine/threonine-protein kinase